MNLAHLHLLLNHFPIIGGMVALGLLLFAMAQKSDDMKRAALTVYAVIALISIPAFMSGIGAAGALQIDPDVSREMISTHEGAAMLALLFMLFTGVAALVGLWQYRGTSRASSTTMASVLLLSLITCGLMARTGNLGGQLRHDEIRANPDRPKIVDQVFAQMTLTDGIGARIVHKFEPDPDHFEAMMVSTKWWWAFMMDLHFVGLALLIGTIGILDLRVMGFAKQLPFEPLHKLVPWALAGLGINVVTGIMAFLGMPAYYSYDVSFWWKIFTLMLLGLNALMFYSSSAFHETAKLGPGEDAPPFAKMLAASSLFLWFAVVVLGRYIQFFEDTLSH